MYHSDQAANEARRTTYLDRPGKSGGPHLLPEGHTGSSKLPFYARCEKMVTRRLTTICIAPVVCTELAGHRQRTAMARERKSHTQCRDENYNQVHHALWLQASLAAFYRAGHLCKQSRRLPTSFWSWAQTHLSCEWSVLRLKITKQAVLQRSRLYSKRCSPHLAWMPGFGNTRACLLSHNINSTISHLDQSWFVHAFAIS